VSGQRKALIIANDEYEQDALRDLLAPAADAEALGRVLGDRQIGDFAVEVVRNEPAHVISAHVEELFSEGRSDDVLLLHFSGHGLKSESGELFFAASNTRPNRLGSTAVSADFVQRCMRASRSRSVVLLLDCCYGGAFAQGVKVRATGDVNVLDSFPQGRTGGGRGRAVITASNAMEYAFEGNRLADDQTRRPSVFTSALTEGLATGDADRDEDGWVSLNELYDYVFDKVREQNPHQTPSRQVELEGDLYLARSRRRRIRPAPIPPDLQAALTDPNMYTRLGAVSELRSRLASDDVAVAAGAYEALADLARTDIRYVAEPADEALSQAALHPEETELHFGQIEQGSAPPHRPVRLLGPPLARACAPRASHDWIRVTETPEGFDVSVDTASAGTLRGTLDLTGPTGEAEIAIEVELLPTQAAERAREAAERQAADQAREAAERQAAEQGRQPAPPTPEAAGTTGPEAIPTAPQPDRSVPQQDAALPEASQIPVPAPSAEAPPQVRRNGHHPRGYHQGDRLATWWQRVGAALIDLLPLVTGLILIIVGGNLLNANTPAGLAPLLIGIVFVAGTSIYDRWYMQGKTGQTWGKRASGLKLVRISDKKPIGSARAFARDIANLVGIFPLFGLGFLFPIWTVRRQTLPDMIAKTVVIYQGKTPRPIS